MVMKSKKSRFKNAIDQFRTDPEPILSDDPVVIAVRRSYKREPGRDPSGGRIEPMGERRTLSNLAKYYQQRNARRGGSVGSGRRVK